MIQSVVIRAEAKGRLLIGNYNYLYNDPVSDELRQGGLGTCDARRRGPVPQHLEKGNPVVDPNVRNPALDLCGGWRRVRLLVGADPAGV